MSCAGYIFQYLYKKETEKKIEKQVQTTVEKRKILDLSPPISFFSPPSTVGTNCREVT
jgi:hypothetical protein